MSDDWDDMVPCPHCQMPPEPPGHFGDERRWQVGCEDCGLSGPICKTYEQARDTWCRLGEDGLSTERHQELLRTIRDLSLTAISPEEAAELRGQLAALIAEIGTLRAALRAATTARPD